VATASRAAVAKNEAEGTLSGPSVLFSSLDFFIPLNGDAVITAVDGSGSVSEAVTSRPAATHSSTSTT